MFAFPQARGSFRAFSAHKRAEIARKKYPHARQKAGSRRRAVHSRRGLFHFVPLFNSKSGTSHQEAESRRGQYTTGGEISDTLPFFVVCRYFRRIYRLPRTLDTLDTLFSQSTRIEKTFPFSLSRALVQKKVCQVCQTVVLPDGHGKSTDTLFFSR